MYIFFADGINFVYHEGFTDFSDAVVAAMAATIAADQGFPSYAAIWSDETHEVVAVVCEDRIYPSYVALWNTLEHDMAVVARKIQVYRMDTEERN